MTIPPDVICTLQIISGLLLMLVTAETPASAGAFESGNSLYARCSTAVEDAVDVDAIACAGYISGISDALSVTDIYGFRACIPDSATRAQVRDIVKEFLRRHPETRHLAAAPLAAHALANAFPCGR